VSFTGFSSIDADLDVLKFQEGKDADATIEIYAIVWKNVALYPTFSIDSFRRTGAR
jgi:hypothetical protein